MTQGSDLWFFTNARVAAVTHEQNTIHSKTHWDGIIWRQLLAGSHGGLLANEWEEKDASREINVKETFIFKEIFWKLKQNGE